MNINMRPERIEELAVMLTRQRSVTETIEEQLVTEKVAHFFQGLDYYKEHPEDLITVLAPEDPWGRKSVISILRGKKDPSNKKTVILIGHTDTVGISDYGELKDFAHLPYELTEKLRDRKEQLPPEVQADLDSGDYLFGRGIFDMKAGNAIIMSLMEEIEKDLENFSGNIIYCAVCDEEANSIGMRSCVPKLVELRENNQLKYTALINTDYMTSEYPGDLNKYVYVGTVGKLMPSFYVVGKETHVGEAFKGLDPNQIIAELTKRINLNTDLCDVVEGEVTLPPMSLKQQDLKPEYSVQTAKTAHAFYNFATHYSTPDMVLEKMRGVATSAFAEVLKNINDQYAKYCALTERSYESIPFKVSVMTYNELYAAVREEKGKELDELLETNRQKWLMDESIDDRDYALKEVEWLQMMWTNQEPVIIVYFTPPYYPHIYVEGKTNQEKQLLEAVKEAVDTTETDYQLVYKKFFPYISDLSYAAAPKEVDAVEALKQNMPGFGVKYSLPLEDMQKLQLPVVDIGPFGKDSHKFTERLEKNYSFNVAPVLVQKTVMNLLK
ncbi:M20/M25/M40 family metallo-hydrolase [Marinilactibacillus psychrotolerans]|uniref:Peptidase M20 n=1 Tax=Marinilactibacillus psychrotolerans TaxID=191770 RepID=A0AAV3X0I5_9LACT|nr:M20/M25/M40 family metallo-hydrolase [Marinilactibacillus psychrotolerans]GEL66383.1 peptidase M20 [Marinilactibacillus psychrotolerans]GEQ36704.1 peptidase M20 [Marinilactibacillus psychrotolerans]SDD17206.1 Arginine utilization protein RocB [Marinilactibacillus psychrotolerans]